jgi:hypothetical protein
MEHTVVLLSFIAYNSLQETFNSLYLNDTIRFDVSSNGLSS